MKKKKFFANVGKGAKEIGNRVRTGAGNLIKKARDAQSPAAQEKRLIALEKKLIVQERLAKRRARIRKLQGNNQTMFGGGMSFFEEPPKKKGKRFDPFSQF